MTQTHSQSPLSSLTSKDPKCVPAIMSLDLIYFETCNQNLTALHVYCCAVLTKNVLLQQLPLYLFAASYLFGRTEQHKRLAPEFQPKDSF